MHLAPRPFVQLARRSYRLGVAIPRGYTPFTTGGTYYRPHRRQMGGDLGAIFARWR
jgi:hypothetical protein